MPVSVMEYEFRFNGAVIKTFPNKELAYHHAFNRGYIMVEQLGIVFVNK